MMASSKPTRQYARISTAIWDDPEFLALTAEEQLAYFAKRTGRRSDPTKHGDA